METKLKNKKISKMETKEKSIKMSKKQFLKLCKNMYENAKAEKAGIIHLHCMINENRQGRVIQSVAKNLLKQ